MSCCFWSARFIIKCYRVFLGVTLSINTHRNMSNHTITRLRNQTCVQFVNFHDLERFADGNGQEILIAQPSHMDRRVICNDSDFSVRKIQKGHTKTMEDKDFPCDEIQQSQCLNRCLQNTQKSLQPRAIMPLLKRLVHNEWPVWRRRTNVHNCQPNSCSW